MAGAVAVGAVLAVARDRAVDEARVLLAQPLVAHAEAVHHAGPEGLEQHVVLAHQPQQHLAAALLLQVQPDRALAAVEREEQRRLRRVLRALVVRRGPADVVAHAGVLDLQHLGAEVGEQQRAEAAGQQPGEVEDLDALERPAHARRLALRRGEQLARLGHRRGAPAHVLHHLARLGDQVAVRARHLAVRQVEVVLEPDAHVAAERGAAATSLHWSRLIPITPQLLGDSGPPGHLVGHEGEVPRRRPDAAGHAHHARDLERLLEQPHVEQRVEVGHVAGVEALVLGLDAELVHRLEELDDRVERVLEHRLEHEVLALASSTSRSSSSSCSARPRRAAARAGTRSASRSGRRSRPWSS